MNQLVLLLILRRIGSGILTLFIVSALVFIITSMLPGDAAQQLLGQAATPETVAALREQLGLNLPLWQRYFEWLGGMFHGDFGTSFANNMPVARLVAQRIPATFELAGITTMVSVPLALIIGITAAMKRGSLIDRILVVGTMSVVAVPEFLVATVLVMVFAVRSHWFPAMSLGTTNQDFRVPAGLRAAGIYPVLRAGGTNGAHDTLGDHQPARQLLS